MPRTIACLHSLILGALCGACVLAPDGLQEERDTLASSAENFGDEFAARAWPPLPEAPTWRDLLQRAFLSNGDIEAAWHEWRAAVAAVTRMSTWPNTNVELGLEYLFSSENMTTWNRTTLSAGFDAMQTLELPAKTSLRGEIALSDARAAGERFRAAKFALQRRFLESWIALAKLEAEAGIQAESLALLRLSASAAERGAAIQSDPRELMRARLEVARAEDALARLRSMRSQTCVAIHALIGAPADVEIKAPDTLPAPRALELGDAGLIALAAESNPKLAELARRVQGRDDALELARAAWWPDVVPMAGLTGNASRFLGASISLPTGLPAIRAAIEEAQADLARSRALDRQGTTDVNASITAELLALRDAERATRYLSETIVPVARQLAASARSSYASGIATQREWLEGLRAELEAQTALVEARAARETSLARLEELVGVDFETLANKAQVNHGS